MLHGLLVGNLATWYFTGARVLARTHEVLLYDLRGHGRSERAPDGYTVPAMCDDLEALIEGFAPSEAVSLVGHSFGALIVLEYALRHPDRVGRLVLVEAPLPPASTKGLTEFLSLGPDEMVEALPDALKASVVRGGRRGSRLLASLRFLAYETTLIRDLDTAYPVTDAQLASIGCPTLVVAGSDSSCRPAGDRLLERIADAQLVVLSGGHYLMMDAPGPLARHIVEFLDG